MDEDEDLELLRLNALKTLKSQRKPADWLADGENEDAEYIVVAEGDSISDSDVDEVIEEVMIDDEGDEDADCDLPESQESPEQIDSKVETVDEEDDDVVSLCSEYSDFLDDAPDVSPLKKPKTWSQSTSESNKPVTSNISLRPSSKTSSNRNRKPDLKYKAPSLGSSSGRPSSRQRNGSPILDRSQDNKDSLRSKRNRDKRQKPSHQNKKPRKRRKNGPSGSPIKSSFNLSHDSKPSQLDKLSPDHKATVGRNNYSSNGSSLNNVSEGTSSRPKRISPSRSEVPKKLSTIASSVTVVSSGSDSGAKCIPAPVGDSSLRFNEQEDLRLMLKRKRCQMENEKKESPSKSISSKPESPKISEKTSERTSSSGSNLRRARKVFFVR